MVSNTFKPRRYKMKKVLLMAMSFCLGIVFVFPGVGAAKNASPYVIGLNLSLTGRAANIGIAEERVYRMKIDEINAAGGINGRKLKPIIYDDETRPAQTVLNTKKIINVEKVIACLGYAFTGGTLASVKTATDGKTVLFSLAASEKIWRPTKKWVFNTTPCQKDACTPILVDNLLKRGSTKIAYIYNDTAYGQTGKETFDWTCGKMGINPAIIEKYSPGSTDVSPQITHIKASGADGLIICGYLADTVRVLKTARDHGITYPIFSEYAVVGPEFIELAGKYGEGVVTTSLKTLVARDLPDSDVQKEVCMALYTKYTNKYGPFSLYAGHAWDSLNLVTKALGKIDPQLEPTKHEDLAKIREQLRDNLEHLKGVVGQNGVYNYSPDNHNGLGPGCYVPVVVQNGEWMLYK
jgi:branched-chain amino acid transport system substrate-binding protein